jgi:hypothetical protein
METGRKMLHSLIENVPIIFDMKNVDYQDKTLYLS